MQLVSHAGLLSGHSPYCAINFRLINFLLVQKTIYTINYNNNYFHLKKAIDFLNNNNNNNKINNNFQKLSAIFWS